MTGELVHRLGTALAVSSCVAAVLTSTALLLSARRARAARRRREALLGVVAPVGGRRRTGLGRSVAPPGRGAWAGAAALGGGAVTDRPGRSGSAVARRRKFSGPGEAADERGTGQLPMAAELLAACVAAGATPGAAADAVGRTLGGPLGAALCRVAAEIRLGGDPGGCWGRVADVPGGADLARWMSRAATTGVPPVAAVSRLAEEYRAAGARSAGARARRAAVVATAPLGLCFLPAFLAVGVAPVVIGLAEVMTRTG